MGKILPELKNKCPIISHLHEQEKVLAEFEDELEILIQNATKFIVVNDGISKHLQDAYGVDGMDISVEQPFIALAPLVGQMDHAIANLRSEMRKRFAIPESAFVVAGCGTVNSRKGTDRFVDVALDIVASGFHDVYFIWLGDGPELPVYLERVGAAGFSDRVKFPGHLADANIALCVADLFFLSSREDPFPLVCLESGQYGIPTVHYTEGTGIDGYVLSKGPAPAGYAIPEMSIGAAIKSLKKILKNRDDVKIRGINARSRVIKDYSAENKLIRLYSYLVSLDIIRPSVSVVVPNYNHEKFINARIDSILNQSLKSLQILLLDDASTDSSLQLMEEYASDPRVTLLSNERNTGSPFAQWRKGIAHSTAEIIWIAESDDLAAPDFCLNLIGLFQDPQVNIAAGRCRIIDADGKVQPGALEPYYDTAEIGLFAGKWVRDGAEFIRSHFGMRCTLVNASSLLLRASRVAVALDNVENFKMCGDWLIYLRMMVGGKVGFSEAAISYFRRHAASTVNVVEGTPIYFRERAAIAEYVLDNFYCSATEARRIIGDLKGEWDRFIYKNPNDKFGNYIDARKLMRKVSGRTGTIALYVHGMLFSKGGIERLAAQLANCLISVGYKVVIICGGNGKIPVYAISEQVKIEIVDVFKSDVVVRLADTLRRHGVETFIPMLSESIFEPCVEAGIKAGTSIIVSEHNDPWKIEERWWSREGRNSCFAKADKIHILLPAYSSSLDPQLRKKAITIPNGVELGGSPARDSWATKTIVTVGRFAPQKRLDLLIEAFAIATARADDWTLVILGDGQERGDLIALTDALGVRDRVMMPGVSDDISGILNQASIYVQSSEFEGLPIVVLEAKRAALPCVAFRTCIGCSEIIEDGVDGFLASEFSAQSLAESISRLMDDEELREKMGRMARRDVEKYDLDSCMKEWIRLVDQVTVDHRKGKIPAFV